MAYETKDGDCVLFENTKKAKEKQPDWRGKVRLNGKDYDLVFWIKTSAKGTTFMSGRVGDEIKEEAKTGGFASQAKTKPAPTSQSALDDDIPW
jgi:hypothetical protein